MIISKKNIKDSARLKQLLKLKKRLFKSAASREEMRSVQKKIKGKIIEYKAAYKN